MTTKTCTICGTSNSELGFANNGRCVPCNRESSRQYYHNNKSAYISRAKDRDAALDDMIVARKNVPCTDCGVNYPPHVMDFDHLGNKSFGISEMRRRRMSFTKIKEEMDKCEVVCANCHRIRTHTRTPSTRYEAAMLRLKGDF